MSRPREWRERSRAKAEAVVSERYIGAACPDPVWCRVNGQLCDGECESYDDEETTDAPE